MTDLGSNLGDTNMEMRMRKSDSKVQEAVARKEFPPIFKPYIPKTSRKILRFPYTFTRHVDGILPQKLFLKDRYENIWKVKVEKIEDQICIVDGWSTFVKQSFVVLGDVIVFRYDGGHVFYVTILGLDFCVKSGAGRFIHDVKDGELDEDQEYDAEIEHDVDINNSDKHRSSYHSKSHKRTRDLAYKEENTAKELKHQPGKRKKKVDPYGFDLFTSGRVRRPENPYFVTQIRKHRQDELYIPVQIIRAHKLNLPNVIVLRDSAGRTWDAEYHVWGDGRCWYTGGWKYLCQVNLIKEDDFCICEFVKRKGKDLCMHVTVVRRMNFT